MLQQNAFLPETKLKHKQNMALYNPCNLKDAYQLKCWASDRELTLVMHKQHSTAMRELGNTLFSAHITTAC